MNFVQHPPCVAVPFAFSIPAADDGAEVLCATNIQVSIFHLCFI